MYSEIQRSSDRGHASSPVQVDLRSDTVTKPTAAMYDRMVRAPVGDDGLDGDPTVRVLEETAAGILGKEAGLFVPSCTMANLLATLVHVQRNDQVVLEARAHMYMSERGSATFTNAFYVPVAGTDGAMDLDRFVDALQGGSSRLRTALVSVETSHNGSGGTVLPLDHMAAVQGLSEERGIPVHLDGARLFNAAIALGVEAAAITRFATSVSLCLCKGLSAPTGAILAGSAGQITRARQLRRMIGGQQRQAGIMAAAGLEAVTAMGQRLLEDHGRARRLSERLNDHHEGLTATFPQTNIVQVDVEASGRSAAEWVEGLEARSVLVRAISRTRLRCVTHRHIRDDDVERAAQAFGSVASAFADDRARA